MVKRLTYERCREVLDYDPETGIFRWRITRHSCTGGAITGTKNKYGYIQIGIDNQCYQAHRLAFLLMTGKWPDFEPDHKDTDRSNNRWSNLRNATKIQNGANRGPPKNNKSGYKGVSWDGYNQKWRAIIMVGGRRIFIGRFDELNVAGEKYKEMAIKFHGEFARAN